MGPTLILGVMMIVSRYVRLKLRTLEKKPIFQKRFLTMNRLLERTISHGLMKRGKSSALVSVNVMNKINEAIRPNITKLQMNRSKEKTRAIKILEYWISNTCPEQSFRSCVTGNNQGISISGNRIHITGVLKWKLIVKVRSNHILSILDNIHYYQNQKGIISTLICNS